MRPFLKRLLTAPVFEDEEKTHQAYLLYVLLWTLIVIPILYFFYIAVRAPQNTNRALAQAIGGEIINFILLLLIRRGYIRLASYAQVFSMWLFFTITAVTSAGVHSEAYFLGYPLVIIIAGVLLGIRSTSLITVASVLFGGWMAYTENSGALRVTEISSPSSLWIISAVLLPLLMVLQYLSSHTIQVALKRAHASEDKYKLVLSISSDYIYETVIDDDGVNRLTWVGGAFEKLTGYTFEEYMESGGWIAHLHPDDLANDAEDLATLLRNEILKSDIRTLTKNGELRWVRISARPIWNEEKRKVTGIIGAVQDITEIKHAEELEKESLQQQASMVRNIPDMAWLKDRDSKYLAVNETFASIVGLKKEEVVGKTDFDLSEPELARAYQSDDKIVIQTQKPKRIEEKQRDLNGREYWVETIKTPVFNSKGEVIGTIGSARDIQERKELEFAQERRRALLEDVIELGKVVTESDDLRGTIKKIWHGVHDVLKFDRQAIFLYNFETNRMDDTFGTDRNGQIEDNWHISFPIEVGSTFAKLLETPDGYYLSNNYDQEDAIDQNHDMFGVKHFVAAAAWAGDKPIAVICADNLITQHPISVEQLEALRLYAGYAGLAIKNSQLNEAVQNELAHQKHAKERERERRAILEKVAELGQYVTEVHDLRTTLTRIWDGIRNNLGFDRVGLFLYDPERKSMDGTFGTNNLGVMTDEWDIWYSIEQDNSDSNSFLHALEKPDTVFFTHAFEKDYNIPKGHMMYGVKDHASVGAWAGEKPIAVIAVDNQLTGNPITEVQLEALRLFAGYVGLAIDNARLHEKIQAELAQQIRSEEREKNRRAILEKVVKLGQHVTEVYDLRTTLIRIWNGVHFDLGFDRLGIRLYNPDRKSMDGTFGTNNNGEMIDEWDSWVSLDRDNPESRSLLYVLEKPDNISFTHTFEADYNISVGQNMSGVKDHAAIAAWAGEKPVAIISVDNRITNRPITEEQLEALRLFGGYAGLAIENARLKDAIDNELTEQRKAEETEQRRRVMMEKVIKLGKQVTTVSDFRTTLQNIWHGVRYDLDFDRVGLFLYNSQENTMEGAYGTDRRGNIWGAWHVKIGLSDPLVKNAMVFHKVLDRPDGFYFTRDYEGEFNLQPGDEMVGVKNYAVIAVWAGNKPVAIISVDQLVTGRTFSDEQLEALRLFAGYAGLAISNANLNTALEEELSQRQNFINELETKNAELERFTYTVSHDLKSPLVTIRGFLGYLERDALQGDNEKFKHDKQRIETAVEKMQNLLRDLLELSRIGRLINPPADVAFNDIVKDALEIIHGQIEEKNIEVVYKENNIIVRCDRIRLTEAVQNLLDNATKFMGDQPRPKVEAGFSKSEEGETVFYIKDNGIGIAPEYHENIFGLFNKLETDSSGTGVGLALVRRIIEVHGGRIWVESQVGEGTTFYFTLPQ